MTESVRQEIDLAAIVEDAVAHIVCLPGEVQEDWPDVVVRNGPNPMAEHGIACRIRFADRIDERVGAVRRWFGAMGRERFVWVLGWSATPSDLEARLFDLGAEPSPTQPEETAMVLDHEPPPGPPGIEIRRISSLDDHIAGWEILFAAFDMPEDERARIRSTLPAVWPGRAATDARWDYLALVDGLPAALGSVRRTTVGPLWMAGGATLPAWRGRGLYRALVRVRWDDAVRLGARALIVYASPMSRPILERLGFRPLGPIRMLVDRSGVVTRSA